VSPIWVRGAERSSLEPKIFRQCRNTALQKNLSLFATHHLLSTAHHPLPFYQSLIAAVSRLADLPISRFADKFGSAGASHSHFIPPPSRVPRPVPFLSHVPLTTSLAKP
jgi:hypothetical protein